MKKRKISQDRYIIFVNNKYFVVNSYTFELLKAYQECSDISYLSKKLELTKRDTKKIYKGLLKEIENSDYYEDNINLDFPLKVQWKITNRCNLKCKHCYLGRLDQKELESKELLTIAKKISNSNIMEVTITGGEALLVNELPEIVNMFIENDIKVNIFTNGVLLKAFIHRLHSILKYHPVDKLFFHISIDGDETTHDAIRGKGNFKRTIGGVRDLINLGYKITTNTVLWSLNYKDIPKLYKYLYNIGVYKIQISNLIAEGNATESMQLTDEQKREFIDSLKEVLKELDNGARLLYAEMPDEDEQQSKVFLFEKDKETFLEKENWKCSAGIGKATINYDGEVYCCPFMKKYSLGNIVKNEFADVWSSKNRFNFLELIAKQNNNSRVCVVVRSKRERKVK